MTESQISTGRDERAGDRTVEYDDLDAPRPFLGPLLQDLRPYRRIIWGVLGLAALATVVAGLALWAVFYPTEKTASLEFRLDFDGAEDGKYPNGTKFSVEDIISEPVVRRVFDENGLQKYMTYEPFRTSLVVTSRNRELDTLEWEYRARLSDTKLPSTDRQRLEREFREKTAAAKTSTFTLTMFRRERLREMDGALMEKVLRGILAAWADDAARIRGAMKYDIPMYSVAMLQKEFLQSEDYIIGIDMLRNKVNRVILSVSQLMKVPGIQVLRIPGSGASLPEVRVRLEDLIQFRIAPTIGIIRVSGLSRDPAAAMRYLESRLFEMGLDQTLAQDRERKAREALEVYIGTEKRAGGTSTGRGEGLTTSGREPGTAAVIPQFGESFIDRLMTLANRNSDVAFRQDLTERMISAGLTQMAAARETAYYKDLPSSFRGVRKSGTDGASRSVVLKDIEARFASASAELEKSLDEIRQLYELVSARNLRPASALYSTERPMSMNSISAFSVYRFLALGLLFVGFAGFVAVAGALLHTRFGRSRARA